MPSFQGCDPGANPFIERYFHDCVYGYQDGLGFVLGMAAIGLWLVAMLPQFIGNIRRGSSDGISVWFLAEWFLGDTLNLLGCLVQGQQLPTTTFLAMYFVLVDVVMLMQFIYLGALQKRRQHLARIMAERAANRHHHHHHRRNASAGLRAAGSTSAQPSPSTSDGKHVHDAAGGKAMQQGGGQDVHFRGAAVHGPSSHMLGGDSGGGSSGGGTPRSETQTLSCHVTAPSIAGTLLCVSGGTNVMGTVDGCGGVDLPLGSSSTPGSELTLSLSLVTENFSPVLASVLQHVSSECSTHPAQGTEGGAGEQTASQLTSGSLQQCCAHRETKPMGDTSATPCTALSTLDATSQQQEQLFSLHSFATAGPLHPSSSSNAASLCWQASSCQQSLAAGLASTAAPVGDACMYSGSYESGPQPTRATSTAKHEGYVLHQCSRPETLGSELSEPLLHASGYSSCGASAPVQHHHTHDRARRAGRRGFTSTWGSSSSSIRSSNNHWAHAHHYMVLAVAAIAAVSVVAVMTSFPSNHSLPSSAVASSAVASPAVEGISIGLLGALHHPAIAVALPHGGRPVAHVASVLPWLLQQGVLAGHGNDSSSQHSSGGDGMNGGYLRRGGFTLDGIAPLHEAASSSPGEGETFRSHRSSAEVALLAGTILGYLSSMLYLTARCAQISKNIQRGTTEGMSILMFAFTIAANTCTGTSIILRLESATQLANQLPWMCGTFGTVSLDIFLLYQGMTMGKQAEGTGKKLASATSSGLVSSLEVDESGGSEVVVVVLPGGAASGGSGDRAAAGTTDAFEPLLRGA